MTRTDLHNFTDHERDTRPRAVVARARATEERGAALVEFALVVPVLLMVLFGIVQFGLALNSQNDETHLANEVARYATVNEDPSTKSLQEWGKSQVDTPKVLSSQTVCINFPSGTSNVGDPVEVTVKGTINWLPVLKLKTASTSIEGKAYMRLEAPPSTYKAGCA
jgi:Flp pilus assembly protein TadG